VLAICLENAVDLEGSPLSDDEYAIVTGDGKLFVETAAERLSCSAMTVEENLEDMQLLAPVSGTAWDRLSVYRKLYERAFYQATKAYDAHELALGDVTVQLLPVGPSDDDIHEFYHNTDEGYTEGRLPVIDDTPGLEGGEE
jgi:hypothetical protein